MGIWGALFWGAFTSSSLYIGEALARPLEGRHHTTGLIMGFGAGTLLSAVAYELIPLSSFSAGAWAGLAFLLGALTYYFADLVIDRSGGADRQTIEHQDGGDSGLAMFLGALLDGIPETFIVGASLASGSDISVAFLAAVFISNIPEGVAGTTSLKAAGASERHVLLMWTALVVTCAIAAAIGFLLADNLPRNGTDAQAFAGGAVLTMLANSMMPEAFKHGGRQVGLLTVIGYLVAAVLAVSD